MKIKDILKPSNKFMAKWNQDSFPQWWEAEVHSVTDEEVILLFEDPTDPRGIYRIEELQIDLDAGNLEIRL